MGTHIRSADAAGVVLRAPIERNLNHRATAFGGSVAAQAILAGWALVYLGLDRDGVDARTVIQRSDVAFLEPIHADFEAHARPVPERAWKRFRRMLERWGRARLRVEVDVRSEGKVVARLVGDYVALAGTDAEAATGSPSSRGGP
jgi:thioesterase domain-containing protein